MSFTREIKQRIFIQTLFFAVVYLAIGAAFGYYYAQAEAAHTILTELKK